MHIGVLPTYMPLPHVCPLPWEAGEGFVSQGTKVTATMDADIRYGSSREQQVLLTTQLSL